jgi:hypothetical protein
MPYKTKKIADLFLGFEVEIIILIYELLEFLHFLDDELEEYKQN